MVKVIGALAGTVNGADDGVNGTWVKNGKTEMTNIFYITGKKSAKVLPVHPKY